MEYGTAPGDEDVEMDPVIWQCSQAVELKRIFANAPVAAPAPPPIAPEMNNTGTHRHGTHGLKRKRWQDQDTPASSSAETLGLIQQLSRTLGSCRPTNPARRNTRISSAGALMLGASVGSSKDMPPPRPKASRSDLGSESCDEAHTPLSAGTSFNWSRESSGMGSTTDSSPAVVPYSSRHDSGSARSSDSNSTILPCTPPARNVQLISRPATEPAMAVSSLIARAESPELEVELPPPPIKPVLSIRTNDTASTAYTDTSAFSSRSNTSESTSTTALTSTRSATGSVVSNTAPISPVTPLAPRAPTPVLDLSPTPSPEPKAIRQAPSEPKPPPPPPQSAPKSRPAQASTSARLSRATTEPAPAQPARPSLISSQHAKSESSCPPTQQFRPPTQHAASRPPTQQQQYPRMFPSSQTRLGLGALGTGYTNANRPFRVPNKGKSSSSTVVALPRRAGIESIKNTGVGGKHEDVGVVGSKKGDAGGKGKEKAKIPASPSKSKLFTSPSKSKASPAKRKGQNSNQLSLVPVPPSPSRRKENLAGGSGTGVEAGKSRNKREVFKKPSSPSPATRPATCLPPARPSPAARTSSNLKHRDPGPESDDSYLTSDGSFDAAAVDADMAVWDSWDD